MGAFLIVLLVIVAIVAFASIKVVHQGNVKVVERLGRYYKTATAGLNIIVPFVDRIRADVSLKENTMDVPPQGVITKDNVTITIDTVVFFQITDARKAVYEQLFEDYKEINLNAIKEINDTLCMINNDKEILVSAQKRINYKKNNLKKSDDKLKMGVISLMYFLL